MPSTNPTSESRTYLITGASRGIGAALVQQILLSDPAARIIASVRDASAPSALSLATNPRITLISIDFADDKAPFTASSHLQTLGINTIDTLYACHGFHPPLEPISSLSPETLREALNVNAVSVLTLFRAFRALLQNSPNPKFVVIASASGSLTSQDKYEQPGSAYAISKVALHMVMRRVHVEEGWLTTLALRPGRVLTDLTVGAFGKQEMEEMLADGRAITPQRSAELLVKFVGGLERRVHGGGFWDVSTGKDLPW